MRFLADENIPRLMVRALQELGHDVVWVRTEAPGSTDERVLAQAVTGDRVLVTADKDFGELAFRRGLPASSGIILLRLNGSSEQRIATFIAAVESREDWAGHFSVIEPDRIRMTPLPG